MASIKLTDILIRSLPNSGEGQVEYFDSVVSGLSVRVSERGAKSFSVLYRFRGAQRRYTLGRYPEVTLAAARSRARQAKIAAQEGRDLAVEKYRLTRQPDRTVEHALSEFIERYARHHTKGWRDTEKRLRRLLASWMRHDIKDIRRQDVATLIDKILTAKQPSAATKALALTRKYFNWALENEFIERSPCAGIRVPSQRVRERVLRGSELAAIWFAANEMGYPFGPVVKLLMLTLQRRGEVAGMEWSQIDLTAATWTIPASHTKANRTTIVPLAQLAVDVIASLPVVHEKLVFPALGKDAPISGFSKWKADIDRRAGCDTWEAGWTLHDLRRTAATCLAAQGVEPHILSRLLNHADGGVPRQARPYNHHRYMDQRCAALESWQATVMQHVSERGGAINTSRASSAGARAAGVISNDHQSQESFGNGAVV